LNELKLLKEVHLALGRDELKKLLKEKGVKSLDDFNAFMREVSKEVVETLLEGELTDHLGYEKHNQKAKATDNARNGFTPKTVKSKFGEIGLEVPRDRQSDFEPQIVKKRQNDISGLEGKIISMYAKGMTTRDIQEHIKDLYGYEISAETVSSITDKVLERAREGQGRPLESVYALIYKEEFIITIRGKINFEGVVKERSRPSWLMRTPFGPGVDLFFSK
jgi:putative transposase